MGYVILLGGIWLAALLGLKVGELTGRLSDLAFTLLVVPDAIAENQVTGRRSLETDRSWHEAAVPRVCLRGNFRVNVSLENGEMLCPSRCTGSDCGPASV